MVMDHKRLLKPLMFFMEWFVDWRTSSKAYFMQLFTVKYTMITEI